MTQGKLTDAQVKALKLLGWDFYPTGPNEWDWLKFDEEGKKIGQGGGDLWAADLASLRAGAKFAKSGVDIKIKHLAQAGYLGPEAQALARQETTPTEVVGGTFEAWICTNEFRWLEVPIAAGKDVTQVRKLQQKWRRIVSDPRVATGDPYQWRDVPVVKLADL